MANRQLRVMLLAAITITAVWLVTMGAYFWTQNAKVTANNVRSYISSINLASLNSKQRAKAIEELARQINALSSDERIKLHMERAWDDWFAEMDEKERAAFVEATLPTGIKQMMASFEKLPEESRKKTLDEAMKRLREGHELPLPNNTSEQDDTKTNSPVQLSAELETRMQTLGLKTFYTGSSAQTKAEVAPLLEEMQRLMKNGVTLH